MVLWDYVTDMILLFDGKIPVTTRKTGKKRFTKACFSDYNRQ